MTEQILLYFVSVMGIIATIVMAILNLIGKKSIANEIKIGSILIELAMSSETFADFEKKVLNLASSGAFDDCLKELEEQLKAWGKNKFSFITSDDITKLLVKVFALIKKKE